MKVQKVKLHEIETHDGMTLRGVVHITHIRDVSGDAFDWHAFVTRPEAPKELEIVSATRVSLIKCLGDADFGLKDGVWVELETGSGVTFTDLETGKVEKPAGASYSIGSEPIQMILDEDRAAAFRAAIKLKPEEDA